jgi:hypothetical protein
MDRKTETFESGITEILNSQLMNLHTSMPGKVVSFNPDLQTISVQPCLKRLYSGANESVLLPIIEDVPVLFPGSGNFFITWDVKPDSYCWLLFSERALATWISLGDIQDPTSKRKFSLSDCVAYVGINPNPSALSTVDPDSLVIRNRDNTTYVKIEADAITLKNADGDIILSSGGQVSICSGNFTVDS